MILKSILLGLGFLFIACRGASDFDDRKVFRYNVSEGISTLDPAFSKDLRSVWACHQLFRGLVRLDDHLFVQPDIAKRWEVSEDGMIYKFILRSDVFFHKHKLFGEKKTRKVESQDFVYSFLRLMDPQVASPGAWVMNKVISVKSLDKNILEIKLKKPFPPFLKILAMKYCSVVPKEAVEYFGMNFGRHPIGTGPFAFQFWKENVKLIFRKNPLYYRKGAKGRTLPYLEAIAITFLAEQQAVFLQFLQGRLDLLNGLQSAYKDELLNPEGTLRKTYQNSLNFIKAPFLNTEYLGICFGASENPAHDIRIRKAMNYGFDRAKMVRYLRNNIGIPATKGFIPKGLAAFQENTKGLTYQPALAKGLVDSYKKDTGNPHPILTIGTNPKYLDLCEYIARALQEIGLTVKIQVMPLATLREKKVQSQIPIFRGSWVADYPDAENYLFIFHSKWHSPKGANYTHYKNPIFDKIYERAIKTKKPQERLHLYQQLNQMLIEQAPVIPLYYDEVVYFTHKNIKGLGVNAINLLSLETVSK